MNQADAPAANEPGRNRRLWLRVFAASIAVIAFAGFINRSVPKNNRPADAASVPAVPVVTATAKTGELPIYLTGLGSVTALNTVTLRTRVDGHLINVAVREGQMVSAGTLVAQIDPRPFQVQLHQAQGQMERDQAILANGLRDLERYRILYAQDSIPKQQFDTQDAAVAQAEAAIKADQAAIDAANLQLIYADITSPITGRIGLRQVDPGNIVHATDQNGLSVITQLQPIAVIFSIGQDSFAPVMKKLQAGQRLTVDVYDRDFARKIATGSLLTVDNQADVTTGTVRFKAVFPNRDNAMFPNQFVNARLLLDVKRGTILIPAAAIQRGPQATFVFVVKAGDTAEVRNVTVGPIEREVASIDHGLSAGELVVTEGLDKLQNGTKVIVRPANYGEDSASGVNR